MSLDTVTLLNVSTPLPSGSDGKREVYLPLGVLYLTASLEAVGVAVDLRDYQLFCPPEEYPLAAPKFVDFLSGAAPVVAISCMVSMLPFVLSASRDWAEEHPESTIILGGPGPSGVAEAIVRDMPWIDVVARGEGEATLVELVQALGNGGDIAGVAGITYRDEHGVRSTGPRRRLADLDGIPRPAYHKVPFDAYTSIPVITGRGCPYQCAFCDVGPLWGSRVVFRSVDSVIAEIDHLQHTYGVPRVHIADDTFDLKRDRVEKLCAALAERDLSWSCLARVDLIDEELAALMAAAGCDTVFLGIESGSDQVLESIGKGHTIRQATEKVALCIEHFGNVIASFIWGFPEETMKDFKATLFSVYSLSQLGARAGLKLLSPMPLSRLGEEYRDRLQFSPELCSVFASFGNTTREPATTRAAVPEDLQAMIRRYPEVFAGFYHIPVHDLAEKIEYLQGFSKRLGAKM
jgi:anaerobic magnesium-protoporphyrin IX monomethyl ester cyclase